MAKFIFKRLGSSLLTVFVIITITFFLMHAIPGGPFDEEKPIPDSIKARIEAKYHLNDPLWKQYISYWKDLLHGDLGPSFKNETETVNGIISRTFPKSALLGIVAIIIALTLGITMGVIAALKQNKWQDYTAMIIATIGIAVPSFVLGPLLMYIFAVKLGLLPPAMWGSWKHVILPSLALSALPTATIARFTRSSMLEVLGQDYIKTAKAKGLSQKVIVYRHALRNAIMPIITYLGPLVAGIFTGSFVVENIFNVPGLGQYFVTSISNRDYTVILGVTIFYSTFLVFMNLLVDIAYSFIDPRIKLEGSEG